MPADAGIFAQIQPVRPRNMLADFADVAQIQGLQQRQQLGALQMDALRQQTQDRNALNSLWAGAVGPDGKIDRNRLISGAAQGGLGAHVPGLQKSFADADKADADSKKTLLENTQKRVELSGQVFGFVRSAPTLENANSALNFLEQNGIFDGPTAAKYREQITANPASIPALAEQAFRAALDAKEQLAKFETRDTGGAVQTLATDPVTMRQTVLGSVQKTQSPDSVASTAIQRDRLAEDKRHRGVTEKQAADRLQFDQGVAVADAGGPSQALLTKQFGKAPNGFRWKPDGTQEAIPGGPADIKSGELGAKAKSRAQHAASQAQVVIDTIDKALGNVGLLETGLTGSVMGKIPGTDAYNLRRQVDTVKANIGFDSLQKMREMSPTGGALGQVAVQELSMLQATIGNLDANQSEDELVANLKAAKKHYEGWKNAVMQAAGGVAPAAAPAPSAGGASGGWSIQKVN